MTPDRAPTDAELVAERWVEQLEQHFRGDPPPMIQDHHDTPHAELKPGLCALPS